MSGAILDLAAPGDRYADYCQWPYDPPAPVGGKLRQSTLLWHALSVAGADRLAEACRRLRDRLGPGRTVYGVKLAEGRLSFEFYFYDYDRLERALSIPRVLAALPGLRSDLPPVEARPYFMFSIDLDDAIVAGERPLSEIDVYVGNPGSAVSSGICHALTASGLELKNFYFFFDAHRERDEIEAKIACSAYLDLPRLKLDDVLWPELSDCGVIVVANKRRGDGVYFSRIRIGQLRAFADRLLWPEPIRAFLSSEARRLDHLLYDVGIDYSMADGRIVVTKSAFYGLL